MVAETDRLLVNTIVGVDLGQAQDYTAISVVQFADAVVGPNKEWWLVPGATAPVGQPLPTASGWSRKGIPEEERQYNLVHLERIPLNTSYPQIVAETKSLLESIPRSAGGRVDLAVDSTGVGRAVVDMMRVAGLSPQSISITGGDNVTSEPGAGYHVPKRELVTTLQVLMQRKQLKVAAGLAWAGDLRRELQGFRYKISAGGHDSYEAWREGTHDDLVLSVAIATWYAQNGSSQGIYF